MARVISIPNGFLIGPTKVSTRGLIRVNRDQKGRPFNAVLLLTLAGVRVILIQNAQNAWDIGCSGLHSIVFGSLCILFEDPSKGVKIRAFRIAFAILVAMVGAIC